MACTSRFMACTSRNSKTRNSICGKIEWCVFWWELDDGYSWVLLFLRQQLDRANKMLFICVFKYGITKTLFCTMGLQNASPNFIGIPGPQIQSLKPFRRPWAALGTWCPKKTNDSPLAQSAQIEARHSHWRARPASSLRCAKRPPSVAVREKRSDQPVKMSWEWYLAINDPRMILDLLEPLFVGFSISSKDEKITVHYLIDLLQHDFLKRAHRICGWQRRKSGPTAMVFTKLVASTTVVSGTSEQVLYDLDKSNFWTTTQSPRDGDHRRGAWLTRPSMEDNAPDVSMDYSFLLESSVLDRNSSASASPASPHGFVSMNTCRNHFTFDACHFTFR